MQHQDSSSVWGDIGHGLTETGKAVAGVVVVGVVVMGGLLRLVAPG
jgi:hypothetical protein